MLSDAVMYQALVEKDGSYEGTFIAAVKTTGIFCRPTCTVRKPKRENVEFFTTTKEAILHGYRPCKVCRPLEMPNETPAYIREILDEISHDPSQKIKDWDLTRRGLEPSYDPKVVFKKSWNYIPGLPADVPDQFCLQENSERGIRNRCCL